MAVPPATANTSNIRIAMGIALRYIVHTSRPNLLRGNLGNILHYDVGSGTPLHPPMMGQPSQVRGYGMPEPGAAIATPTPVCYCISGMPWSSASGNAYPREGKEDMERRVPTREEVLAYLKDNRNWGRWGPDDQVGAVNMVTPEKRAAAARLVRSGRAVSMSRDFPKTSAPNNSNPAHHYMKVSQRGANANSGACADYLGIYYHGLAATHLDALCHVWDEYGMWNGRNPAEVLTFDGAAWGSVHHWKEGIITRGVLLDVPKHRGEPFVTMDKPVHGWELEDIAREEGVSLQPGDALVVYSGREEWDKVNSPYGSGGKGSPGLHASCLKLVRESDCCLLVWDMMDLSPTGYDVPWSVHGAIFAYGIGLLDNALLQPLAEACTQEGRYEFMLTVNPLPVVGGTGSPVNPIALF